MPASELNARVDSATATFERLFSLLRRTTPADGVSLTAASSLRRLEQGGPHRVTELAALEGVSQPAITQLVSRLERDRLVQRTQDPVDGRVVLIDITDAGRAVLRRRRQSRGEVLTALLAQLTPDDQAAIAAAIPALDRLADLLPPRPNA